MNRAGVVDLPLHRGEAPYWLVKRMKDLVRVIFKIMIDEFGTDGVVERIADPFWFQSLSCVLAYDWHSSGTTTVVCGVLKSAIEPEEFGIGIAGGKGRSALNTPSDIEDISTKLKLSDIRMEELKYASKMAAKVDNVCVQDNYQLYHHSMIISESGKWAVIQQGMNIHTKYARRYHWLSSSIRNFVEEPHKGIVGVLHKEGYVLDMTSKDSEGCRKASSDIAKMRTSELERIYKELCTGKKGQKTLLNFYTSSLRERRGIDEKGITYRLPRYVNWEALREAYERQPEDYEALLNIKGIGPATARALALIAELIYGEKPSWKDPVKFSFAFGGKDGVPYPVDKKRMEEVTEILRNAVEEAKMERQVSLISNLRAWISLAKGV
ncbi:MAG: DUF763 domain-containing protein [Candidatus Methanospirareceae archaeon]